MYKLFILLTLIVSFSMAINIEQYLSLVVDVHRFYMASSIFFIHDGDNIDGYGITNSVHKMSFNLSTSGTFVQTFIFQHLNETKVYYNKIVRPLFVVFLTGQESIDNFSKYLSMIDINYPAWLVIFLPLMKNNSHPYCDRPTKNTFNIQFKTIMVVQCTGINIVKEWYSFDNDEVETSVIGKFEIRKGLVLSVPDMSNIYNRRTDLQGRTLRAMLYKDSILISLNRKKEVIGGVMLDLIDYLSRHTNSNIEIVKAENHLGGYDNRAKAWYGAMKDMMDGNIDVAFSGFAMNSRRFEIVDFSKPIIITKTYFYFRETNTLDVRWFSYVQVFDGNVWYSLLAFMAMIPILLAAAETLVYPNVKLLQLLLDRYLSVWGILCQQSMHDFPRYSPLRLAYFSIFLAATSIITYYSACLMSHLTIPRTGLPFATFEDFLNDKSYRIIVLKDGTKYDSIMHSQDAIIERINAKLKSPFFLPKSVDEAFVQVCNEKVAFYDEEPNLATWNHIPCRIARFPGLSFYNKALMYKKNYSYKELIDWHLQAFCDTNAINRFLKSEEKLISRKDSSTIDAFGINNIAPLLVIIIFAHILCIIALMIEKIFNKKKATKIRKKSKQKFYRS